MPLAAVVGARTERAVEIGEMDNLLSSETEDLLRRHKDVALLLLLLLLDLSSCCRSLE